MALYGSVESVPLTEPGFAYIFVKRLPYYCPGKMILLFVYVGYLIFLLPDTYLMLTLNHLTIALISHASKVMLKILQARLQHYVNRELPDV